MSKDEILQTAQLYAENQDIQFFYDKVCELTTTNTINMEQQNIQLFDDPISKIFYSSNLSATSTISKISSNNCVCQYCQQVCRDTWTLKRHYSSCKLFKHQQEQKQQQTTVIKHKTTSMTSNILNKEQF
jgi:hypothetical protein